MFAVPVWSQTKPTEGISPTDNLDKEVDKLKEKVAEKVSELEENSDQVTSGVVNSIDKSSLTVKSDDR